MQLVRVFDMEIATRDLRIVVCETEVVSGNPFITYKVAKKLLNSVNTGKWVGVEVVGYQSQGTLLRMNKQTLSHGITQSTVKYHQ